MNFNFYMNYHLVKKGYTNIEEIPVEEIINTIKSFLTSKLKSAENDIIILFKKIYSHCR